MAAKCKKCDPHEICEECPEWIFTLADLIMCMMGLFVLLWVLKPSPTPPALGAVTGEPNKQQEKMMTQVIEIRKAFGWQPDPSSKDPVDQAYFQQVMRLVGPGEKGKKETPDQAAEGTDPDVLTIRAGKEPILGTKATFDRGQSQLTVEDGTVLRQIAKAITGYRYIVVVKGHASKDDFENPTPQALMDISLRRAQAAADYLVQQGVSPDVVRVQGCSTFEPVKQRAYGSEAQAANRRVEVFSTDLVVRDLQDPNNSAVAPLN